MLSAIALVLVAGTVFACFSDFFKVKAAIDNSSDGYSDVYFNVPEVIYLAPNSTTYQYVCDQTLNTSNANPITPNGTAVDIKGNTTTTKGGNVNFYCATASNVKITVSSSRGGTQTVNLSKSQDSGNTIDAKLYSGSAGANQWDYIIWDAKYTDTTDGLEKHAQAITYVYSPNTNVIATEFLGRFKSSTARNANIGNITAWVTGFHSWTYNSDAASDTKGTKKGPGEGKYDQTPLTGTGVTAKSLGRNDNIGNDQFAYTSGSGFYGIGDNDCDGQTSDNNGAWDYARNPYIGEITVDSSRFTNIGYVPNVRAGLDLHEVWAGGDGNCQAFDLGYGISTSYQTSSSSYTNCFRDQTVFKGTKYSGVRKEKTDLYNLSVLDTPSSTTIYYVRGRSYIKSNNGNRYSFSNAWVRLRVTPNDKSSLRNAVANATKEFARFGVNGISNNKPTTSVFSSTDWSNFQTAYSDAVSALTKVNESYDSSTITSLTTTLNSEVATLKAKQGLATAEYYSYDPSAGQTKANAASIPPDVFPRDSDRDQKVYTIGDSVWATAETISGYDFTGEVDVFSNNAAYNTRIENITNGKKAKYVTNDNIVFRFYYKPKSSVASFDANGGSGGPSNKTIKIGTAMPSIASELPTKTGYSFNGYWDDASNGTRYYNNNGSSAHNWDKQADTTLYAHWTPNTYTVAYNGNGYTGGSTSSSSHTYDVSKNLTANGFERKYVVTFKYNDSTLAKENSSTDFWSTADSTLTATYSFNKWNTASNGSGTPYNNQQSVKNLTSTSGATVNLYAQWNTGSVTLPDPGTRPGYSFLGWYDAASGGAKIGDAGDSYTPSSAKTLYAHWSSPATYTASFLGNKPSNASNNIGGTVSGSITVTFGANPATLSGVPTLKGWTFNGYYTAASGGTKVFNANGTAATRWCWCESKTLYAQWTANSYTVSYSGNGNTSGSTASSTHSFDTAKALTSNGFVKRNTATFYPNGSSVTPAKVEDSASNNATVTKNVDWTFVNWTASGIDSQGTQSPYTNGQSVKNLTATSGATVTLTAQWTSSKLSFPNPTRPGYAFAGWYENTGFTGTKYEANTEYTVDSNKTFYAKWVANAYTIKYVDSRSAVADQISFSLAADGTMTFNGTSSTSVGQYILWPLDAGHSYTIQIEKTSGTFSTGGNGCIVAEPTNSAGTAPSPRLNVETSTGNSTGTKDFTATSGTTDYIKVWYYCNGNSATTATDYKCKVKLVDSTSGKTYYVGQTQETIDVNVGNLPIPTRAGYTFAGWYSATSGGTQLTSSSKNLTTTNGGSVAYYARWTGDSGYTVKFDEQNGTPVNILNVQASRSVNDFDFVLNNGNMNFDTPSDNKIDDEQTFCYNYSFTGKYVNSSGTAVNSAYDYILEVSQPTGSRGDSGYAVLEFYKNGETGIGGDGNKLSPEIYYNIENGSDHNPVGSSPNTLTLPSDCTSFTVWYHATKNWLGVQQTDVNNYNFNISISHGLRNVTFGSNPSNVNVPVYTGYEFQGYYTKTNGGGTKVYNADGTPTGVWNVYSSGKSVTLYAYWVPTRYYLDVNWDYTSSAGDNVNVNNALDSNYAKVTVTDTNGFLTSANVDVGDFYQPFPNTYVWTMNASVLDSAKYTFRKNAGGYGSTESRSATMTSSAHAETFHIEPLYKIAYNANDISANSDPTGSMSTSGLFAYTQGITLTSNAFSLPGYTFTGWNTKANGTGTAFSNGENVARKISGTPGSTITLYAQWRANTYTITFDEQNGIPYNLFDATSMTTQTNWGATYTYTQGGTLSENGKLKSGLIGTNDDDVDRNFMETNIWNANDFVFKASNKSGNSSGVGLWLKMSPNEVGDNNSNPSSGDVYKNRFVTVNTLANTFVVTTLSSPPAAGDGQAFEAYSASNDRIYYRLFANNDEGDELDYTVHIELLHGIQCAYGQNPKSIKVPTWTGYEFLGYYTAASGGEKVFNADGSINSTTGWKFNSDKRLYAHWQARNYYIHFNGNGATSGSMADIELDFDESRALPSNAFSNVHNVTFDYYDRELPALSGTGYDTPSVTLNNVSSTFSNWVASGNLTPGIPTTYSNGATVTQLTSLGGSTVTLTAQWNPARITLPVANDKPEYTFIGWYTDPVSGSRVGGSGETVNFTLTADTTLYAHWSGAVAGSITFDEQNGTPVNLFNYNKTYTVGSDGSDKDDDVRLSFRAGSDGMATITINSNGGVDSEHTNMESFVLTRKYRNSNGDEVNNAKDYVYIHTQPTGTIKRVNSLVGDAKGWAVVEFYKNNGYDNKLSPERFYEVRQDRSAVHEAFELDSSATNMRFWLYAAQWASINITQIENFSFKISLVHGLENVKFGEKPKDTNIPIREGYRFLGYFTESGKQYYDEFGRATALWAESGDVTLYAHWDARSIIIFDEQCSEYPVNLFQKVERGEDGLYRVEKADVKYSYDGSRIHILGKQKNDTDYSVMETKIWNAGDFIFKADNKNTSGGGLDHTWLYFILFQDDDNSREPVKFRFDTKWEINNELGFDYTYPITLYRDVFSAEAPPDRMHNSSVAEHFHQYTGEYIWFKIWADSDKGAILDYSCDLSLYHGIQADYGFNLKKVRVPTQVGATFKGYYDQPYGGTQYFDANGNPVRKWDKHGDAILYGQWEGMPHQFDVKFGLRNGYGKTEATTSSLDYNGVNYGSFDVYIDEDLNGTYETTATGLKSYSNSSMPAYSLLELKNITTPQGFTFEKYVDSMGNESNGASTVGMRIPNDVSYLKLFIHRNSYKVRYKPNGSNVTGTVADTIHDWDISSALASGSSLTNKYNLMFNYDGATTLNGAPEDGRTQVDCGNAIGWSTKADPDDPTAQTYSFGQSVTRLTDEDFNFNRVYEDIENGPTAIEQEEASSGMVLLYAKWAEKAFSNFPTPEKLGFEFGGWYDNPAFSGEAYTNGKVYTVKKDTQFYAKWIRIPYKNVVVPYDFTTGITADIISDQVLLKDGGTLVLGTELNGADVNTVTSSTNIKNPTSYIEGSGFIAQIKSGTSGKGSVIEFKLDENAETTGSDFTIYYEYQFKTVSLNQYMTGTITFVPANNTYYEEYNFRKTNSVNPVDEDEYNTPSDWETEWTNDVTAGPTGSDYPVYGYSANATADISDTFSNRRAYRASVSESVPSSKPLEFEFNGKGFDLYSACGNNTSVLMVYVFSVTEENGQKVYTPVVNAAVDTYLTDENLTVVNNRLGTGRILRQVPVYHFVSTNMNEYLPEDGIELESPTYLVQVYSVYIDGKNLIGCASPEEIAEVAAEEIEEAGLEVNEDIFEVKWVDENSVFNGGTGLATATDAESADGERAMLGARPATRYGYVDGIRTLNPSNPAVEEYKFSYDSGYVTTEQNARFYNLKQFTRNNAETLNEYTGYKDKLHDEGEEPVGANPINEVYLAPYSSSNNSATSFKVEGFGTDVRRIMISARAVSGSPQILVKSEGSDGTLINLVSGTSLYYDITDYVTADENGNVTVIIAQSNGGSAGYAAIENVKLIYSESGLLALAGGNSHRVGLVGLSASEAKDVADSLGSLDFGAAANYNVVGSSSKATIGWPIIIKNMMPVDSDDNGNTDNNGNGDADVPGNNGDTNVPGNVDNGNNTDNGKDKQNPEGNKDDNDGGKLGGIGIKILGYDSVRKVDYRSTVVFRSEVSAQPAGSVVKWYVDDKPVFTGDDFTLKEVKSVSVVQAKVISEDGSTVLASSTKVTINPKTSIFQRIIAFFRSIFGRLPLVDDGAAMKN